MIILSDIYIFFNIFTIVIGSNKSFNIIPRLFTSSFSCKNRNTGFYADVESNCQLYYTCDDHGNKFLYNCPQDTVFNQETLVCDHTYRVDCKKFVKSISQIVQTQKTQENGDEDSVKSNKSRNTDKFSKFIRFTPQPSLFLSSFQENNKKLSAFGGNSSTSFKDHLDSNNYHNSVNNARSLRFNQKNSVSSTSDTFFTLTRSSKIPRLLPSKKQDSENFFSDYENLKNTNFQKSNKVDINKFKEPLEATKPSIDGRSLYSATLTTIQNDKDNHNNNNNNINDNNSSKDRLVISTTPTITAKTDFPIPNLGGSLFYRSMDFNDDPYYPRYAASTEQYTFGTFDQTPLSFATQRIGTSTLKFRLLDALPDLSSVEDLVDRRKHHFIPKFLKI
ncbi:GATA zinc finger domain-containing protein 4-like [Microplitis mediator]|uniref:GATA zinc finger domain-containing protein 4-like n=1 Tax=Microplitis mediator TaxID=375433 RepID=UPI00255792DD|nr:GATA zinc finger domain-containing protein 4-like [Microplitis mediator]